MDNARKHWTKKELRFLEAEWAHLTLEALADRLGRTQLTVYVKAQEAGLCRRECWATLQELSIDTGYSRSTLKIILKWAGIPLKRANLFPREEKRRFIKTRLDRFEVHEAVDKWTATENLRQAATLRGKDHHWISRRLKKAGLYKNTFYHRYLSTDIDRAIAEYTP